MIFTWLRNQGREEERTRVYGFTRSWSKTGSAVSVIFGAVFVFNAERYADVFFYSAVPCVLSIINVLGYPKTLEGRETARSAGEMVAHLRQALGEVWSSRPLRRLFAESMGFEGTFMVVKDYLQPVLRQAALAAGVFFVATSSWSEPQQTAVLVGAVYFVLYLFSAFASRKAHVLVSRLGDAQRASRWIWAVAALLFAIILIGGWWDLARVMIPAFVLLHILQNFWRPILIGRIDRLGNEDYGATVMSLESQAKRLTAFVLAPVLGWAVDSAARLPQGGGFWPLGLLGLVMALFFLGHRRHS